MLSFLVLQLLQQQAAISRARTGTEQPYSVCKLTQSNIGPGNGLVPCREKGKRLGVTEGKSQQRFSRALEMGRVRQIERAQKRQLSSVMERLWRVA